MKEKIFITLFFIVLAIAFGYSVNVGMNKQEIVECNKIKKQSEDFSEHFFMNQAWKNACDDHGIMIDQKFVRPADFDTR